MKTITLLIFGVVFALGALAWAAESAPGRLIPLCDLSGGDGRPPEEIGLYGHGHNEPPEPWRTRLLDVVRTIRPRDREGRPAADGRIVLTAFSMSNASMEFELFETVAMLAAERSPSVAVVNCAQGGQAMAEWADPAARPWAVAAERLERAGVTTAQVQAAWVKLANICRGESPEEYAAKLEQDTVAVLRSAKLRCPNLAIVYLGSRIYGGYATTRLNPEPFAYESGRVARRILQRQMRGDAALNPDPARGQVRAPWLCWGPYLWADGERGRAADDLVWRRGDFVADGTHPSPAGCAKVAEQLMEFFLRNPLARPWFVKNP
ncbi:MAG: hypothetical protein N2652_02110 [Kiritimatiellae bacterium]|nr:hypothetical protein [Kiritimatiellia bacterium]